MPQNKKEQLKQFRVRSDVRGGFLVTTTLATIASVRYLWWRFHRNVADVVEEVLDIDN